MGATFGWPFCVSNDSKQTPLLLCHVILGLDPRIHAASEDVPLGWMLEQALA